MPTLTAPQRGLLLVLAAIVMVTVDVALAPALGATANWVVIVLSVVALAAAAHWTWKSAGR